MERALNELAKLYCCNRTRDIELLSSGSYGFVYSLGTKYVARLEEVENEEDMQSARDANNFQDILAEKKIAPNIVGQHYWDNVFVTVMDRFDFDLSDVYDDDIIDRTMIDINISFLLRRMANNNLICFDLKPNNIVVNVNNDERPQITDMKLIDFGGDFCVHKQKTPQKFIQDRKITDKFYKKVLYAVMLYMYYLNTSDLYGHDTTKFVLTRLRGFRHDADSDNELLYAAMVYEMLKNKSTVTSMLEAYNPNITFRLALSQLYDIIMRRSI